MWEWASAGLKTSILSWWSDAAGEENRRRRRIDERQTNIGGSDIESRLKLEVGEIFIASKNWVHTGFN